MIDIDRNGGFINEPTLHKITYNNRTPISRCAAPCIFWVAFLLLTNSFISSQDDCQHGHYVHLIVLERWRVGQLAPFTLSVNQMAHKNHKHPPKTEKTKAVAITLLILDDLLL